ncbi:aldo/keto reductase [Chengkuizengella axinellae]|uniref:Aldo/keto reductase n=1 Tax=Chengkuizengella axinellae TaxID=3064388 RepID=A0ABT9J1B8_9BACL|nr:aldo/keto reductase [Chengkuizengella sp. 2205SS18-9]MDP5275409.1 aldo/keto reductase [Chengkuizengella sp. 2205SS18-9]
MTVSSHTPLRNLGTSDLKISALGLGTWQFSKGNGFVGGFWPVLEKKEIEEIIQISLRGGINWFDTAEAYGKGKSEEALAEVLNGLGDEAKEALIATKWWPVLRTAKSITQTIDQRLQALKGRAIDLYMVHQPFSFSNATAEMNEMAVLLKEGKINHVGVSNFNERKMREAHRALKNHGFPLVSNQMKYSMIDRRIEKNGVLDAAKELGITIIAYSPLEQGLLTGKFHKKPELIKNITGPRKLSSGFKPSGLQRTQPLIDLLDQLAQEYHVSASQIVLNWTINFHGDTIVAIPGATKKHHAEENVGALSFRLSDKHLAEIDRVSKEVSVK